MENDFTKNKAYEEAYSAARDDKYFIYNQDSTNRLLADAPVGILGLPGAKKFANSVNKWLIDRRKTYLEDWQPDDLTPGFIKEDYQVPFELVRFSSGEG